MGNFLNNRRVKGYPQEYMPPPPPPPQSVQRLIQLCIGSWSRVVGSSDVTRTLHTSARPVARQGNVVFDPRLPSNPRVPLRCVRYYDAKIRLRSTKTICKAGSLVAYSGGEGGGGVMYFWYPLKALAAVLNFVRNCHVNQDFNLSVLRLHFDITL